MSMASGFLRSTLNPNAPPFIPSSIHRGGDFSPEWWELAKASAWFDQKQGLVHNNGSSGFRAKEEDDIAALLPENFELEEFPDLLQETPVFRPPSYGGLKQEKLRLDVAESLELKSSKLASWSAMGQSKYWEKPAQSVNPRHPNCSRMTIHQPR